MRKTTLFLGLLCVALGAQVHGEDSIKNVVLDDIIVSGSQVKNLGTDYSASVVTGEEMKTQNNGSQLPLLLKKSPSLTTYSEDGLGIGNVYFRLRGTESSRINMTINGIPLNDSESQNVFWINMTDLASSLSDINIQRGVGTSSNGQAAFGGSVNMTTDKAVEKPYAELTFFGGSYSTFRESVKAGTGLMKLKNGKGGFAIDGRYSKVNSKGYIEGATSDMYSYYASGAWYGDNTMVKLLTFGGEEHTGISWDGTSPEDYRLNPRYNPAGLYVNDEGETVRYANNKDNMIQRHYQVHVSHVFNGHWNMNAALHYTHDNGYTEDMKANKKLNKYGLDRAGQFKDADGNIVKTANQVRRKYLISDFYGAVINANYKSSKLNIAFGGALSNYDGLHHGRIMDVYGANYTGELPYEWYRNYADKLDGNVYVKANWQICKGLSAYADLQYRHISYWIWGSNDNTGYVDSNGDPIRMDWHEKFDFFNPKVGLTYTRNGHTVYGNFAIANREPLRNNYTDTRNRNEVPKHETLYDYEVGYNYTGRIWSAGVNLYYMDYNNQLVVTGQMNDVGAYLTKNVKDSYRMGIELEGGVQMCKYLRWDANLTLSRNKIKNYVDWVDNYTTWGQEEVHYGTTTIANSPSLTAGSTVTFAVQGFTAALQTNYVSKQYLDNTGNEAASIPQYCVNNLNLSYVLPFKRIVRDITFSVQMNNIFNQNYVGSGWVYSYFDGDEADANGVFHGQDQHYDNGNIGYYAQARFNIHGGISIRF